MDAGSRRECTSTHMSEVPLNKYLCRIRLHLRSSSARKINILLDTAPGEPVFVSIIPVLSKPLKEEDMSRQDSPPTVVVTPYQVIGLSNQRDIEMREYRRGYFSMVVAVVLARARRECDSTDDITNAVANCHISQQPGPVAGPSHQNNPFQSPQ